MQRNKIMRHGGDLAEAIDRYGIPADDWLDLSTGINPYAYPARSGGEENRLPAPRDLDALLAAARTAYNVPDRLAVCAAPGTEILIRILPWLIIGETALVETTYRSYAEAWAAADKPIANIKSGDIGSLPADSNLVLVNPNNPDGRRIAADDLLAFAETRSPSSRLIVDEAFADTDPGQSIVPSLCTDDPVIVLKSFGKFFGLPGIRLGFAVGTPALIEPIAKFLGDWPVSVRALSVGHEALCDTDWQDQMRRKLEGQTRELDQMLSSAGIEVTGGTALFRLFRHNAPQKLQEHLANAGIWVRIFDEAPGLVRIGLPGTPSLHRLRAALANMPA